jgi:hypothetical protein
VVALVGRLTTSNFDNCAEIEGAARFERYLRMKRKKRNRPDRPREIPESARRLRELYARGMADLEAREARRAASG